MRRYLYLLLPGATALLLVAAIGREALERRNLGIAELENEQPAKAEAHFQRLVQLEPDDPLGHANLAIAYLRQQKHAEALQAIGTALQKAPGRADLLAIQGEILQWSGRRDEALPVLERAARAAPEDPQILYALYRLATTLEGPAAGKALGWALENLARLRPENVVVLLQLGQQALRRGDRAAATKAYLRIGELLWQAPPIAQASLDQVLEALKKNDLEAARVPSMRLENVLKVTPMYQQSLRELSLGIQGVPVTRFAGEPAAAEFGDPLPIRFAGTRVDGTPTAGKALGTGDFDGDEKPDLARITAADPPRLEIRLAKAGWKAHHLPAPKGLTGLLVVDLDNDGNLDLAGYGPQTLTLWRGKGDGSFEAATESFGLAGTGATAAAVLDFDIEGDLDLVVGGGKTGGLELYRNALQGPLEAVGRQAFPALDLQGVRSLWASDLDRDEDLDLLVSWSGGLLWLDNLRQGEFADRTKDGGLVGAPAAEMAATADLNNDGLPDLIIAGEGIDLWRPAGGRFEPWSVKLPEAAGRKFSSVLALDADNDGRLDLAAAGPGGLALYSQRPGFRFVPMPVSGGPQAASALAAADLDGDGDLDLLVAGPEGLHRLENQGGHENRWLAVRLRGLTKGNSKNNLFGLGSTLEVRAGGAYQFREATGDVTHFGLGKISQADLLRVTWTNGVPQNRIQVVANQWVVEEQVLKGSCPFLYTWDGDRVTFVTDLLWGAPLGLPLAPGVWAPSDPEELVRVDGARPRNGIYDLRITEELWEAAFFDLARLWVVDHPEEVEVASSLRIVPGERVPHRILASRNLRPVAGAWDGQGVEVTGEVRFRDEIYADGYRPSPYQGVADEPWSLTFDLGEAPAGPIRLHLDGWIFPTDASLNLALAQRQDLAPQPPRLEVETEGEWRVLLPNMGFPPGKTKTMVVETPPLPPEARRLRITTNLWISWDRIAWTQVRTQVPADSPPQVPADSAKAMPAPSADPGASRFGENGGSSSGGVAGVPADSEVVVVARLAPDTARLRYRGFSAPVRQAPNGPHTFDYQRVTRESPWLPFPGRYTRYGDVRELLLDPDDRYVILAPGDELALTFDASGLPPTPPGWRRTVFLESHGWDKDADRNTYRAQTVEPLPFRAMTGYPYGPDESYPDTPLHRQFIEQWLTREVGR